VPYVPRNKQSVETVVADAPDQLLNNYINWRVTKTALALFVHAAELTTVIEKVARLVIGSSAGSFTDPDGLTWYAASV
jgi:uncharacterized glyoxalase superfamily protein PhnB